MQSKGLSRVFSNTAALLYIYKPGAYLKSPLACLIDTSNDCSILIFPLKLLALPLFLIMVSGIPRHIFAQASKPQCSAPLTFFSPSRLPYTHLSTSPIDCLQNAQPCPHFLCCCSSGPCRCSPLLPGPLAVVSPVGLPLMSVCSQWSQ